LRLTDVTGLPPGDELRIGLPEWSGLLHCLTEFIQVKSRVYVWPAQFDAGLFELPIHKEYRNVR